MSWRTRFGPSRTDFKVVEYAPNHTGDFTMTARMSDEKIALAKKMEAEGVERNEICRRIGTSPTTLIKHLGTLDKATKWTPCACGDHVFAPVGGPNVCLLDPQDADLFADKKIFFTKGAPKGQKIIHSYAVASNWPNAHRRVHRVIMRATDEQIVDHISRDTMDNRRRNLRVATSSSNGGNSIQRGGTSKYKGVSWSKQYGCWVASIMVNRKSHQLGRFHSEENAARVYDAAAIEAFGEFARTNFEVTP